MVPRVAFGGSQLRSDQHDALDLVELVAHNFSWESLKGSWILLDRLSQYFNHT
jgi:hypothetical protein